MPCCCNGFLKPLIFGAVVFLIAAGAIKGFQDSTSRSSPSAEQTEERRAAPDPALSRKERTAKLLGEYDTSNAMFDESDFLAPGIPRDGIPSLTDPVRTGAREAEYPASGARVIEVVQGGEAIAYPLGILNWHEIINDRIAGVPIAVTYCPLCDSVAVFDRRLTSADGGERIVDFGVSGLLCNSNVVMYDRVTMGLWSQVLMQAISGPDAGQSLRHLPFRVVRFSEFQRTHPAGQTVVAKTGHERDYDRDPYSDYIGSNKVFHGFEFRKDLPAHALGLGVRVGAKAWFVQAAAAMDAPITLETDAGKITVTATGDGIGITELPEGATALQTFFHSWSAFYPHTQIVPAPAMESQERQDAPEEAD